MTFIHGGCRKSFIPPEANAGHFYLSVYGLINTGTGAVSSFNLTRSQNLSDTVSRIPETGCTVAIRSSDGSSYPLTDSGSNGNYVSTVLNLDTSKQFKLSILNPDGIKYESDWVHAMNTPPIDSLNWTNSLDGASGTDAVSIFLNTHDPLNNTRFYRWDYTETWEHQSEYKTFYLVENKKIVYESDLSKHNWYCWSDGLSSDILIGTSAGLSADRIEQAPVTKIYQNDPKMDIRYSILVRQYALSAAGYDYWTLPIRPSWVFTITQAVIRILPFTDLADC